MAENTDANLTPGSGLDNSLQIAVLGQLLKKEKNQTAGTIEGLASLLEAAIPERVVVTRGGWYWSKVKPVQTVQISLDDAEYHIAQAKNSAPTVTKRKIVRGINLKSSTISMEDCINEVVAKLGEIEKSSAATRIALQNFVNGR